MSFPPRIHEVVETSLNVLQNGQLHSGDHILQIGEVNVRGMSSEQVAAVLRQSGREVRLIVARPVNEPSPYPTPHAPVVPTHQLDEHLQQINAVLHGEHMGQHMPEELTAGMIQVHMVSHGSFILVDNNYCISLSLEFMGVFFFNYTTSMNNLLCNFSFIDLSIH